MLRCWPVGWDHPPPSWDPGLGPFACGAGKKTRPSLRFPNAVGVVARSRLSLAQRLHRLGTSLQQFCRPCCWWWCCCCCCSGMSTISLLLLHCLILSHFCFGSFVWEAFRCAVRESPGTLIDKIRSLSFSLCVRNSNQNAQEFSRASSVFVEDLRLQFATRWEREREREREREILQRSCRIVDL
jgi:hypothetical protein